ncbi:hypothetical protein ACEWY4_028076 [Coilia grayii]|uniref:DUF5641 domain-containing protein n=1 Tax=Coilia grayii TaxID=363190 RepID=A0ABD1INC9_9TELE
MGSPSLAWPSASTAGPSSLTKLLVRRCKSLPGSRRSGWNQRRILPLRCQQGGDDQEVALQTKTYDQLLEPLVERISAGLEVGVSLRHPTASSVKVGDVALIGEDNAPRQSWKLEKIEELFPDRDRLVRPCAFRTSTGTVLRRPIQLLYPLYLYIL